MAPILINAAASVAGNVIDSISEHFSKHHGVHKASKTAEQDFDSELAQAQATSTATASAPASLSGPVDPQSALMSQVLGSPEVAGALAGVNPSKPVQVEMTANGGVSLRNANGELHALKVSDATQASAAKLYAAQQMSAAPRKVAPVAVLAVDPTRTAGATWSKLPVRAA